MLPTLHAYLVFAITPIALGCGHSSTTQVDAAQTDGNGVEIDAGTIIDAARVDAALVDAALVDAALLDAAPTFDAPTPDAAPTFDAAIPDANPNSSGTLVENFSPAGGGLVWTCPDGTAIAVDADASKRATICLGIDGSECFESGVAPGPDDALCTDPNFNVFKDTCVETYFSCFEPAGSCSVLANNDQLWGNGALQDRNAPGFIATYRPTAQGQPCITATLGSGIVTYQR